MQTIYSHPNSLMVELAKSFLEFNKVDVTIEHSFIGPRNLILPPCERETVLLLKEPLDEPYAHKLLKQFDDLDEDEVIASWTCQACSEANDPSFDWCWCCQTERYETMKH